MSEHSLIKRTAHAAGSAAVNVFILLFSLFCLFPVYWMLASSVKNDSDFYMNLAGFPQTFRPSNYLAAVNVGRLDIAFVNSAIVSGIAVFLILLISFVMGIVFARYQFKGKGFLYIMFLSGMLIPVHALLIPIFIELRAFSMLNNRFALALVYTVFGLPKGIFLVTAYASTIPREIEEAVFIDGGNIHQLFFKIFMPMCSPVLGTLTILSFLDAWNEFPFSLILMGRPELKTLPIALTYFQGQYFVEYTMMMAGLSIATLPVVIVYFIFHKRIMQGMVAGSVKG
ncbi:MAG: carbohydrate ABC transporter permease [Oscillospiraceae bacterium]|nr:carbohydrate ABC transporter permease [Oscillospiraceae bacterium]